MSKDLGYGKLVDEEGVKGFAATAAAATTACRAEPMRGTQRAINIQCIGAASECGRFAASKKEGLLRCIREERR